MRKKKKPPRLPDMSNWTRQQIAEFWDQHDSADYWDEMVSEQITFRRKRQETITLSLDPKDVKLIKSAAKKLRCTPMTLVQAWVKEKVRQLQKMN